MKIAYISSAFFCDCDIPLIREMTNLGHEIIYILQMSPHMRQATLVNVPELMLHGDVYPASNYKGLEFLYDYLPMDRAFVQNMASPHEWHPSSFISTWKLISFLKHNNFDIIHLTYPLRYSAFPLYMYRHRMILTMHDPIPHSSDMNWLNKFHRWMAFKNIKNYILLSESLKDAFVKTYRLHNKQIYLSRLGRYEILTKFQPIDTSSLPEKYILFAGSINPHKGIKYLCEAMAVIHKQCPNLSLIIAGRGNFDFDIEQFTKELPIITHNRFISNEELITLIKNSRFVVCPYIDATQSGVIMSAFAFNKPVICTNVGALSEMVQDGRHGILVKPKDSISLASAIIKINDDSILSQMARNINLDYTSGKRSWKSIAEETLGIYHKILR